MIEYDDSPAAHDYVARWRKLAAPLVAVTGLSLYAFDPNIVLTDGDGHQIVLPAWFVEKINQHLPNPEEPAP